MDLVVDATGSAALQECYLLACVGKSRKLFKHGDLCKLPLSTASPYCQKGRIDILRRVGSAQLPVDTSLGTQDLCIRSDGFYAPVNVTVFSSLSQGTKEDLEMVREKEKHLAQEYLKGSQLQEVLGDGVREVLRQKPRDPRKFLADWLARDPNVEPATSSAAAAPKPFVPYTFKPSIGSWLTFLPDQESKILPTEFEVVLDRSAGEPLGLEFSEPDGVVLQVKSVDVGSGLLGAWARASRSLAVEVGDYVLSVNGVRGRSAKLLEECEQSKPLRMQVKKQSAFDSSVDCEQWLQSLKNSFKYPCNNQQRELTPCQELCKHDLAALLARYDADGDGKLSLDEFEKLARSELWQMTKLPPPEPLPPPPWACPGTSQQPTSATEEETGYRPPEPKQQTGEHLKLGIYQRDDGEAMGALSLRYTDTESGYDRSFVFTVTATSGAAAGEELWSAHLEPAGFDSDDRELWRLPGLPAPTVFVQEESNRLTLLECDLLTVSLAISSSLDAGSGALVSAGVRRMQRTKQRKVWTFQEELCGMFFTEPVGLPLEQRSKNFVKAVIAKDPSTSEEGSPDTQDVVRQYAGYNQTLPDGPIHRQMELVNIYTKETPLYHEMNIALREDNLEKMKVFGSFIKELRDVFLTDHEYQIIKPFVGTVWRGISSVPDMEKARKMYKPGKDFLWPAFTSTTTDKNVAMRWGQIVFEIVVDPPEGMYDDEVWEFAPADIKEFSAYKSESEVLFPPNVKFRILEVLEEQGKPLIRCLATALDGVGGQVEFGGEASAPCLVQDAATAEVMAEPLVKQLVELGYAEVRARRALRVTRNDFDAAKSWLEQHQEDPDIDAPLEDAPQKAVVQRVQARPKVGMYVSDKGSVGRLCIQKGRCGKRRAYIFSVHEVASPEDAGDDAYWVARLVFKGQNRQGRDVWTLDGHPEAGIFVNDKGNFMECKDNEVQEQRQVWRYKAEHPSSPKSSAEAAWPSSGAAPSTQKSKPGPLNRHHSFTWDSRREMA